MTGFVFTSDKKIGPASTFGEYNMGVIILFFFFFSFNLQEFWE
jgi:hypothetical protein